MNLKILRRLPYGGYSPNRSSSDVENTDQKLAFDHIFGHSSVDEKTFDVRSALILMHGWTFEIENVYDD